MCIISHNKVSISANICRLNSIDQYTDFPILRVFRKFHTYVCLCVHILRNASLFSSKTLLVTPFLKTHLSRIPFRRSPQGEYEFFARIGHIIFSYMFSLLIMFVEEHLLLDLLTFRPPSCENSVYKMIFPFTLKGA